MSDLPEYKLCITVCTRQRPKMLSKLISSYLLLEVPENLTVSLVIVENDRYPQSEPLVQNLAKESLLPIKYYWEPKLGIPCARNRCLSAANEESATHIAFVDDDEWFTSDWLVKIWTRLKCYNHSTAIQGKVISNLPPGTGEYLQPFFQPKPKIDAQELSVCATNNAILDLTFIRKTGLRFDESKPYAGGTDAKFFRTANSKGLKIYYCEDAVIHEDVPITRASIRWLTKRHFRHGLILSENRTFPDTSSRLTFVIRKGFSIPRKVLKSIFFYAMKNKTKHVKTWLKACQNFGEIMGSFNYRMDPYKQTDGH